TTTMGSDGECVLNTDASGAPVIQAHWQAMLDGMSDGDYLFVQFGINDGSATCDRHVGVAAFKAEYAKMAAAARERGAHPIFVTPVSAVACNGSTARTTRDTYANATLEVGAAEDVPVIDLHRASVDLYDELGFCPIPGGDVSASTTGPVGDFFCDDHTHFSATGAPVIAGLVADAVREQGLSLSAYLE
ncbi:MAG TPA: GDSL-type esterase/lipase family protein, partial [Polyangiaceae bacterium]|nr:GDSL-type esterase/lipase family protein [Polyangiaceae bacterium]